MSKKNKKIEHPPINIFAMLHRLERVLSWLETQGLGAAALDEEAMMSPCYRWRQARFGATLIPISQKPAITLDDILGVDEQKHLLCQNTEHFLAKRPANNVLLSGARGTGKSSLVRALVNQYYDQGLRLIEVDKESINEWHALIALLEGRPERYILYCDDLSFDENERAYKAVKSILDGGLQSRPDNVLFYASSNRRHLLPEYVRENLSVVHRDEEIHPGEAIEEKISLSERFGLWLSFYSIEQSLYLKICHHWLSTFGVPDKGLVKSNSEALRWSLQRGSRSGRIAEQFARHYAATYTRGRVNPKKNK